ncbi:MAG: DMT family transporter [Halanaeroarchaeum sp.]
MGLFLGIAAIWGGSFVAIEIGLHHVPPLTFAGLRYLVAGSIVLGYARITAPYVLPRNRRDGLKIAVFAIFFIFANHAFLYLGEQYVSGAIAAVVVSLSPVLTAVFAGVLLGEQRLDARDVLGFTAGILGVVIIAQPSPASLVETNVLGLGLVFVAAVSFALGAVLSEPIPTTIPISSLQGWAMIAGSTMLLAGGSLRGESLTEISVTPAAVATFLYLTLVAGAFAYLLYFTLLDYVGPTELNLVGYLEPVGAAIVSWAVLGEIIDTATLAGFVAIFAGFALIKGDALVRRFGITVPSVSTLREWH